MCVYVLRCLFSALVNLIMAESLAGLPEQKNKPYCAIEDANRECHQATQAANIQWLLIDSLADRMESCILGTFLLFF